MESTTPNGGPPPPRCVLMQRVRVQEGRQGAAHDDAVVVRLVAVAVHDADVARAQQRRWQAAFADAFLCHVHVTGTTRTLVKKQQ